MKILGVSFGKKMGSNEVLVKEALMGVEETGVEIQGFVRALDLDIKPCKDCLACTFSLFGGGSGECGIKDDFKLLDEQLMECDGMIVGAPIFILGPSGYVKDVSDRRGPSHDITWLIEAKKMRASQENPKGKGPDERAFKKRYAGFFTTGGASTANWLSFGLAGMHLFTFPTHVQVVDHLQVDRISTYFNVVANKEALKRARQLGRNVAQAVKDQADEPKWMGDEVGICPVCHCNLLTVFKKNPVECPICGIRGELEVVGDEFKVTFSEEEKERSRLKMGGKLEHWLELQGNFPKAMANPEVAKIPELLKKYEGYKELKLK
jgi:multimeric flavodoxin WrbA